jgi:hypothetical protein
MSRLATLAVMCAQGDVPGASFASTQSHSQCTGHSKGFLAHVQPLVITPLPVCKFFRDLSLMQTVSPSRQMAAGQSDGSASNTVSGRASDGTRNNHVYAISHNAPRSVEVDFAIMFFNIERCIAILGLPQHMRGICAQPGAANPPRCEEQSLGNRRKSSFDCWVADSWGVMSVRAASASNMPQVVAKGAYAPEGHRPRDHVIDQNWERLCIRPLGNPDVFKPMKKARLKAGSRLRAGSHNGRSPRLPLPF